MRCLSWCFGFRLVFFLHSQVRRQRTCFCWITLGHSLVTIVSMPSFSGMAGQATDYVTRHGRMCKSGRMDVERRAGWICVRPSNNLHETHGNDVPNMSFTLRPTWKYSFCQCRLSNETFREASAKGFRVKFWTKELLQMDFHMFHQAFKGPTWPNPPWIRPRSWLHQRVPSTSFLKCLCRGF